VLGLLQSSEFAEGGQYYVYDLVQGLWTVVYSVCTDPQEQEFFLVALAHVTPFVSNNGLGNLQKEQYEQLKVKLCTLFNECFGNINKEHKGLLFNLLYGREFFVQSEDLCSIDSVEKW
jgi:hypothetical protein